MTRVVEATVPADRTDGLINELRRIPELMELRVQRGVSIQPPGDVVSVQVSNASLHAVMRLLEAKGVGRDEGTSITASDPLSTISPSFVTALTRGSSDATWEEMETTLGKESDMIMNASC